MDGINAFFHAGSAVASILLVYLLLRRTRQRDLLRQLLREHSQRERRRLRVEAPLTFLRQFADALGVPFDESGSHNPVAAKIDAAPLFELHRSRGINLIRCFDSPKAADPQDPTTISAATTVEFHLSPGSIESSGGSDVGLQEEPAKALSQALGGGIRVAFRF